MIYSAPEPTPRMKGDQYVKHVDALRARFTIRIEAKSYSSSYEECTKVEKALLQYLTSILSKDKWCMQEPTGFVGLYYFWFMDKEDALAFALKFGGRVA